MNSYWWIGFNLFILAMLAVDLGLFNRRAHSIKLREALLWVGVCVITALLFNVGVWHWFGERAAVEFLTGYVIELALSVDNVFVFAVLFTYFSVPQQYQHRVLFLGIMGALVLRAAMIFSGIALLERFHWLIYVFGAFLILTGLKFIFSHGAVPDPEKNPMMRLIRRIMPVTDQFHGQRFFIRHAGKLVATPLLVVLVLVEFTDVIFALDSIPAILAITRDPFIVYTSNVFAIICLRSLYFALAGVMDLFAYLHYGLAAILIFVGVKMLLPFKLQPELSLGVVGAILAISIIASLKYAKGHPPPHLVEETAEEVHHHHHEDHQKKDRG